MDNFICEQASWLDDLLNEAPEPDHRQQRQQHRRCTSDSQAFWEPELNRYMNPFHHHHRSSNHSNNNMMQCGNASPFSGRVDKGQYIAHLETAAEIMKAEGSAIATEIQFMEQQNMILSLENGALRQRLDTISHEHMIKQWEKEMLEREIVRLQTLHQHQMQQMHHHQQQLQQQQHNRLQQQQQQRNRNRSRNLDQQMNRNNTSKASVSAAVQA